MIAAALVAVVSTAPGAAGAQTIAADDICNTPEHAADLIKEFNDLPWRDGRKVVDIEHIVTLVDGDHHLACHGIWDIDDGRRIEGTLSVKHNVAGELITRFHGESLPVFYSPQPSVFSDPPSTTPSSFYDGAHDRMAWETWFNGLTGEEHDGAYFWAAQRSLPVPANCTRLGGDGTLGCLEAKKRLDPSDARRKSDPEYRAGWNSIHSN